MEFEVKTTRCTRCPSIAVAEVDGIPLCEGCLLSLILSSRKPELLDRIRPIGTFAKRLERKAG